MMQKIWTMLVLALFLSGFPAFGAELNTGPWRFELQTANARIPFIVEFSFDNKKRLQGNLYNGKETIPLKDIVYRKKEISIPISNYEISLELSVDDANSVSGYLVRHNKNPKVKTPVIGMAGGKERYPGPKDKALIDLSGKWQLELLETDGKKDPAVGIFKQEGNYFTGSILTMTGDYRYLEGFVSGENFEAASFDGVYNYVFRGSVKKGTLDALISSASITGIKGVKDPKATLPSAYSQTKLPKLKFMFPDLNGKHINLEAFKNKAVIVTFFGSWCPNCLDETQYLIPWYKENRKRGVEIVALAFERSLSPDEATRQLIKTQKKLGIPFTILQAGSTSEDKPKDKIEGLENFISFPTTVFLNRKHEVVKVHAGFSGPSTGEFFNEWKKEFNATVDELVK